MVDVANDPRVRGIDLPAAGDGPTAGGMPLARVLQLPAFRDARVSGLDPGSGDIALHAVEVIDADTLHLAPGIRVRTAGVADAGPGAVITLPAGTDLRQVALDVLTALVRHQQGALAREEAIHQSLLALAPTGASLDDICRQITVFLGGAAFVTTTDGRILASGGPDDAIAEALGEDCFDRTGRFITEDEPLGYRRPGGPELSRAVVRVLSGSADLARLVAIRVDQPLGADDVHLLERAASAAALTMSREEAVSAVASKYRAEFLRDALAGRAGNHAEAVAHADSLGWDLRCPMVVVVAETDEDDAVTTRPPDEVRALQQRFSRAWVRSVSARDPRTPVMGFSQEVVTVLGVSEGATNESVMRTVDEFVKVVRGDGGGGRRTFATGVSRPVTSVDALPRAYDEALKAVSVGRQMHGEGSVTHFDGLGIFRLIALIPDSDDLRRFVDESLGELAGDDSPDNADMRRTLEVLIDTNINVAETARQLFFHYNTLRYRIAKLERMLGPFTTDPQLRLTLALALRVLQMRGLPSRR